MSADATASDIATLLPSPMKRSDRPLSGPRSSVIVIRSAMAWHGWAACESALITGTVAFLRQLFDGRVSERPDGHRVDVLAQDPGEIGNAFTNSKADVLASQEDRVSPQPRDRRLEAHTGAQRGLLEQEAERAPRERQRALFLPVALLEP